jgi:hypothetical protein
MKKCATGAKLTPKMTPNPIKDELPVINGKQLMKANGGKLKKGCKVKACGGKMKK